MNKYVLVKNDDLNLLLAILFYSLTNIALTKAHFACIQVHCCGQTPVLHNYKLMFTFTCTILKIMS